MSKEILLVYQDCYDCGKDKEWFDKVTAKAAENSIIIRPVPFNAPGAKSMILDAAKHGYERMPFLTDGNKKFSYSVGIFVPKAEKIPESAEVLTQTKVKAKKNGKKAKTKAS